MITIGCHQDTGRKLENLIAITSAKNLSAQFRLKNWNALARLDSTRNLFSLARLSVAQLELITTIYLQDLWEISANANILFEIFITHHFTNSRDHVFNGKFAMDVRILHLGLVKNCKSINQWECKTDRSGKSNTTGREGCRIFFSNLSIFEIEECVIPLFGSLGL